jgi:peptidoglycan/xylan/chitin deacetylase (PgdA/CDA1 family)
VTSQEHVGKRERLARVLGSGPVEGVLRRGYRSPAVLCLTYHRVADTVEHDPDVISVTPAQLEYQAAWLRDRFLLLSGAEVADVVSGRRRLDRMAVALTFDDAYEDNFSAGRMLHERYGIPATFFVPTAFIESGRIPVWDRMGFALQHTSAQELNIPALGAFGPWRVPTSHYTKAISLLMGAFQALTPDVQATFVDACEVSAGVRAAESKRSLFMSWDQLRQLQAMGHTIGAHTHTHPVLATLSAGEQEAEIRQSKTILEQQLSAEVTVFAYPFGKPRRSFSDITKGIVGSCGFTAAFSFYGGFNRPGQIDPFDVKRIKIDLATSPAMFRVRVLTRGQAPV